MTASIAPTRGGMSSQNKLPRGYELGRLQQFTPEQMQQYQQQFGNISSTSDLARMASGEEGIFNEMEAPAMRQFSQQQGGIASRFSQAGLGGRKSSGFQNFLGQQGADFAQNLQAQRQQLQRQALQDLMGYSNQLLGQRPEEQFLTDKKTPWWYSLIQGGSPIAGGALGGLATGGNPLGIAAGATAGYKFGQGFA